MATYGFLQVDFFKSPLSVLPKWEHALQLFEETLAVLVMSQMTYLVRDYVVDAEGWSANEFGIKGDSAARLGSWSCIFRSRNFQLFAR